MLNVFLGVKGLILDQDRNPIPSTSVMIDNRKPFVKVTNDGEFWRVLLPGTYTLKVKLDQRRRLVTDKIERN